METVQELIPLAREMVAQRPTGKLVKLYVLGSVLVLFGVVLGLVETVCSPFTAASRLRDEEAAVAELQAARRRQALGTRAPPEKRKQREAVPGARDPSLRAPAS
ncbi:PREDICTED: G0/G1 switch protein 2 [Galeopterus variegatus]|uniref:G0/G1 switch protein 2 n=1 Tax=Galeopterus variegatus TaxID=482537 RepID=A0ABM0RIN8_GALVR|nr:PREDICTED: G0/G1 switch protein 2 [Galeopterus variegatus]